MLSNRASSWLGDVGLGEPGVGMGPPPPARHPTGVWAAATHQLPGRRCGEKGLREGEELGFASGPG